MRVIQTHSSVWGYKSLSAYHHVFVWCIPKDVNCNVTIDHQIMFGNYASKDSLKPPIHCQTITKANGDLFDKLIANFKFH